MLVILPLGGCAPGGSLGDMPSGDEPGRTEHRLVHHPHMNRQQPGVACRLSYQPWEAIRVTPVGFPTQFGKACGSHLGCLGDGRHRPPRFRCGVKSVFRPPAHMHAWVSHLGSCPMGYPGLPWPSIIVLVLSHWQIPPHWATRLVTCRHPVSGRGLASCPVWVMASTRWGWRIASNASNPSSS